MFVFGNRWGKIGANWCNNSTLGRDVYSDKKGQKYTIAVDPVSSSGSVKVRGLGQ